MKKLLQSFLCASLLFVAFGAVKASSDCCNTTATANDCCDCKCSSIFVPRSAGDDLVRQATYKNFTPHAECCFGGNFGVDYRYQRSRDGGNIAKSLFGSNVLTFQGSTIKAGAGNNVNSLLADNFGLAPDTNRQIGFCPTISNNIFDFELYFKLDELYEGLFVQFNAPLVHTKFNLSAYDGGAGVAATAVTNNCNNDCSNSCNTSCGDCDSNCGQTALPTPGTATFNPGCMGNVFQADGTTLNSVTPAASFENALSGNFLFGNMQTPWNAGRFNLGCDSRDTKLASFNMILGYNAWECDDYNLGIFIRAAAPTGTDRDCCDFCCDNNGIFSSQIGENFWKLGGGLTGRYDLYNCNDDHFVTIYAEGYINHLFERCQVRSFDFKDKGCMSRYMLLKEFNGTGATGKLINGINFATRNVKTSISIEGEGQIEIGYKNNCGFSAGLGWNIFGHDGEEACNIGSACDSSLIGRNFGIKGCSSVQAQVYDLTVFAITADSLEAQTLNSTQSAATIRACGATDNAVTLTPAPIVSGGELTLSPCGMTVASLANAAVVTPGTLGDTSVVVTPPGAAQLLAVDSVDAVFVTGADLDINSGLLRSQLTNKVFGHLDYQWDDCKHTPKVYVGGEVEFASDSRCASMNAWAVYLGGSINF